MFEILTLTPKGWANTWLYPAATGRMTPETFPSRRSAKAALDEFFAEAAEEIALGQRPAQTAPKRRRFRISQTGAHHA